MADRTLFTQQWIKALQLLVSRGVPDYNDCLGLKLQHWNECVI
jgi:hypothetical protein